VTTVSTKKGAIAQPKPAARKPAKPATPTVDAEADEPIQRLP